MNDAPTKEELLAAGFKKGLRPNISNLYLIGLKCHSEEMELHLAVDLQKGRFCIIEDVHEVVLKKYTGLSKANINKLYEAIIGCSLDFTPKEKTYSWDEVSTGLDLAVQMSIENSLFIISGSRFPSKLRNKLIALVKLEYIIKAIEADCNIDESDYYYYVSWLHGDLTYHFCHKKNVSSIVRIKSQEAVETLIKHHADLIKDALGVE